MANLSQNRTNGQPSWKYYVEDNPNWKNLVLEIEKGLGVFNPIIARTLTPKSVGDVYVDSSVTLKGGERVKLLSNKYCTFTVFGTTKKYALCAPIKKVGLRALIPLENLLLVSVTNLRKPTVAGAIGTTGAEDAAIAYLNNLLKQIARPIDILIPNRFGGTFQTVKSVVKCRKMPGSGNLKADFALIDINDKEVFWISHKDSGPNSYQQYSGLTRIASDAINKHPETQRFFAGAASLIDKAGTVTSTFSCYMKSAKIYDFWGTAIFGKDYTNRKMGRNNCNIIVKGLPKLKSVSLDEYELTWTDTYAINGDFHDFETNPKNYPTFVATFRNGRSFDYQGKRYNNVRVGLYPAEFLKSRKAVEIK